jgi:hypothetical protein
MKISIAKNLADRTHSPRLKLLFREFKINDQKDEFPARERINRKLIVS